MPNTSSFCLIAGSLSSSPFLPVGPNFVIRSSSMARHFSHFSYCTNSLLISSCSFSLFLASCVYRSYNTQVTNTLGNLSVGLTLFHNLTTSSSGAAIMDSSSGILLLDRTVFRFCYSGAKGGAVCKASGNSSITNCCFYYCKINVYEGNDIWGNGVYANCTYISFQKNSLYRTGDDTTQCGDTPYVFQSSLFTSKYNNVTYCYCYSGACLQGYISPVSGSVSQYNVGYMSSSHNLMENWYTVMTFSNECLISNPVLYYYFFTGLTTTTLSECTFVNNTSGLTLIGGGGTLVCSNCVTNVAMSSMTFTSYLTTPQPASVAGSLCFYGCSPLFSRDSSSRQYNMAIFAVEAAYLSLLSY